MLIKSSYWLYIALLGACLLTPLEVYAGVTAERTRVIFHEGEREASLAVVNQNPYPVIVQVWSDNGDLDSAPETANAPIIPLPAVFRLNPLQQRSLRLLFTGQRLPQDRESLYWLNLYEIPPRPSEELAAGESRLTVTLRTQMKLIYRPKGLQPTVEHAPSRLIFRQDRGTLRVENPTPYVITLVAVEVRQDSKSLPVQGGLIAPFSQRELPLPRSQPIDSKVHFSWIDDDGNHKQGQSRLY